LKTRSHDWRPTRLWADIQGSSAVEFAMVVPLLALLVLGLVDYGTGVWEAMMVGNAARAGAYYAAVNGWTDPPTNIQTAVTSSTGLTSTSECPPSTSNKIAACPIPTQVCYCDATPSGLGTPTSCGATCGDGSTAATYVKVSAQASYSPLIPINQILGFTSSSILLSATTFARIIPIPP
jgi:Flp pilus assembly protein TadG